MPIAFGLTDHFPRIVETVQFEEPVSNEELEDILREVQEHYEEEGWNSGVKTGDDKLKDSAFYYVDKVVDGRSKVDVLGIIIPEEPDINEVNLEYEEVDIIDDTRVRNASEYGDMLPGKLPYKEVGEFAQAIDRAYEEVMG